MESTAYKSNKTVIVGANVTNSSYADFFEFPLVPNTNYGLFMMYKIEMPRSRRSMRDVTIASFIDASQNFYFVGGLNAFRAASASTSRMQLEIWMIAIICVATVLILLLILLIGEWRFWVFRIFYKGNFLITTNNITYVLLQDLLVHIFSKTNAMQLMI